MFDKKKILKLPNLATLIIIRFSECSHKGLPASMKGAWVDGGGWGLVARCRGHLAEEGLGFVDILLGVVVVPVEW